MTAINQTRMSIALHTAGDARDWIMLLPIPKDGGPITTRDGRGPYTVANAGQLIADSMRDGKIAIDVNHSIDIAGPQGSIRCSSAGMASGDTSSGAMKASR